MEDKNLKVEALRSAAGLHCSPIANGGGDAKEKKPSDVVDTAKKIYEWLRS